MSRKKVKIMSSTSFVELLNAEVKETTTQRALRTWKKYLAQNPDMTLLDMKKALQSDDLDSVFDSIQLKDLVRVQRFKEKVNKTKREVLADQLFEFFVKHPKGREGLTRPEIIHHFNENETMVDNLNDVIAMLRRQGRASTTGKRKELKVAIITESKPAAKGKGSKASSVSAH